MRKQSDPVHRAERWIFSVQKAVQDNAKNKVLLQGGNQGSGEINNATGRGTFVNGASIPSNRSTALLGSAYDQTQPNYFTRRRPTYYDASAASILDVQALGAAGDDRTDDTAVLNCILDGAANTSSIVYFPFGVYKITDTLKVPVGSRIIGQAWSQIMATGANFQSEARPRVAVQVGKPGTKALSKYKTCCLPCLGQPPCCLGTVEHP